MIFKTTDDGGLTNIFKELKAVQVTFEELDTNTLRSVIKAFNSTSLSVDDLSEKFGGLDDSVVSYLKNTKKGQASMDGLSKSIDNSATSMISATAKAKILAVALNALTGLAISLAIKGIAWAVDELIVTLDEQKEKLDDAVSVYEESKTELEQINDELKTTASRIDELNGKDNLTFTEQDELEKLIKTNDELERKIYLLEQANKEAEKEVATEAQNTYDKYTNNREFGAVEQIDFYANSSLLEGVNWDTYKNDLSWLVAQYRNQQELLTNAQSNGWTSIEEQAKSNLELLEGYMSEASLDYQDLYDKIGGISDFAMTEDLKLAKQDLDDILDIVAEILGYGGQRSETSFDDIWNSEDFSQYKTELETLAKEGKLDASVLESNEQYKKLLEDTGATAEDTAQHINALVDEMEQSGSQNPNGITVQWELTDEKSEAIDNFKSQISTLSDALEKEMSGTMTDTDLSELLVQFPQLEGQTDNLTIALRELINGELTTLLSLLGSNAPDDLIRSLRGSTTEAINFAGNVDKLQGDLDTLRTTLDEVKDGKSFSAEEMAVLINRYGDLDEAVIELADGGYSIEQDKLVDLMNTKIEESNTAISAQIEMTKTVIEETRERLKAYQLEQEALKSNDRLAYLMGDNESGISYIGTAISEFGSDAVLEWEMLADNISYEENKITEALSELLELEELYKENTNLKNTLGKGSGSSSSKNIIDHIETLISRIQRTITNLGKTVSATYKQWSIRNNALAKEMQMVNQEIGVQQKAYERYMAEANSVPLAENYKALVRSGAFDISTITDDTLREQIESFQTWYEKALDCADAIEDLRAELADLARTKFDGISTQYDNLISQTNHYTSMLEGYVDQAETAGYMASEVYYKAMAEKQEENISQLQNKYSSLLTAFDEAVKNGSIEKYSDDWYEMLSDINDVEAELQSATTQLIEFNQTLQQLSWDVFDRVQDSVSGIAEEANFLIDLLDSRDLHTDKGVITDEGLAVQGLHAVNYNTYMEQAIAYAEEMARIEEEMANDPYDLELVDRRNELIELQQEAISNAMSEKEAIHSLWEDGYSKMLDSLQKVIDKREEMLDQAKSLHDYEKSIANKTSEIASIEKQLAAYRNDDSESAKATIQQLRLKLETSRDELAESEYERYIEEQKQIYSDLYDSTEQWVNERLDNLDGLVAEAVDATNKNAETISSTIKDTANSYGYEISDQMETIWDSANNVVSVYGDIFHSDMVNANNNIASAINGGTTNVITAIDGLGVSMKEMTAEINRLATINANSIASAQNAVVNGQANVNQTTSTPSVNTSNTGGSVDDGGNKNNNPVVETYTVRDAETKTLLCSGTDSQCKTWMSSHSYKESSRSNGVIYATYTGVREEKYRLKDKNGNIVAQNLTKAQAYGRMNAQGNKLGWKMEAYASGTTNAAKGFNLVSDGNGDEIILTNDGNAVLAKGMQLFPFEGGETVFDASKTAELLKGNLVPLSAEQLWGNIVKTPSLPNVNGGVGGNVTNDIQMNIAVKADNFDEFCTSFRTAIKDDPQCRKLLRAVTIDETVGRGGLRRNIL